MFGTRNSFLRTGLTCLLLALGVTALLASAASAASPTCEGGSIKGQGSTLQSIAQQQLWAAPEGGYNAACGANRVAYTTSGDLPALESWGFIGSGSPFGTASSFISTDAAPNPTQIAAAQKASGSSILTIPVAQTAIAFVVNPPTGCEVREITNKNLESVMRGTIKLWNKIQSAEGEGCLNAPITRVVPAEASGTTYQTKNYLSKVSEASLTCLPTALAEPTWRGTEGIGASGEPNTIWPENGVEGCVNQVTELVRAEGLGGVVKKINVTEGSFGFAALPESETFRNKGENPNGDTHWLWIQNNGISNNLKTARFARPTEGSWANCLEATYPVPTAAQAGAANPANANWSQAFYANTNAGGPVMAPASYPLCALTYVEALTEYSKAGFSLASEATAKDYIANWLTAEEGQEEASIGGKWYLELPGGSKSFNVLGAARYAAEKIGY